MTDTIFFEISFPRKNPENYVLEPDVMFWVGAKGGFHLVHLLVFSFVYQFQSRIEALVSYMKKNVALTLISFAVLK